MKLEAWNGTSFGGNGIAGIEAGVLLSIRSWMSLEKLAKI